MLKENSGRRVHTCFYDDNNPNGIKIVEMRNSNIQAVFIPRPLLHQLKDEEELKRPAIYFLFGNGREAYIGEAAKVYDRLKQHASPSGKEFWEVAVAIVGKNSSNDLNKMDAQNLENMAYLIAMEANVYNLNQTIPSFQEIDQFHINELNRIFEDIRYLLGSLDFPLLGEGHTNKEEQDVPANIVVEEEVAVNTYTSNEAERTAVQTAVLPESKPLADITFYLSNNDSKGIGKKMDGKSFLVCKGSVMGDFTTTNFPENLKKTHEDKFYDLLASGVIEEKEDCYVFVEDYLFDTVSAAGNFVARTRTSGPSVWRDINGKKLKDYDVQSA
ncbi:GIY-YIG nuclease family protein [Priestia sp. SB1]|uniref:GIY-YIG nuclease family protein n=1 Tax=Priestia sp. SB1 TaxID=3132359 RepID=UPI00317AE670